MPLPSLSSRAALRGFTLTELAIVLVIVALMIGGMLVSLSTTRDLAGEKETQKQLTVINDALIGFMAAQQRLPCPAAPAATGVESPAGGACTHPFTGFVPAITLGITPANAQGYAIDAWGNPIRYAVTTTLTTTAHAFTTAGGLKAAWASDPTAIKPDLFVCSTAAHVTANDCPAAERLTDTAVAIVFSTGRNGGEAPTSADELANGTASNDKVFVSAAPGPAFDDLLVWLSPNTLYGRLIAAGRLP